MSPFRPDYERPQAKNPYGLPIRQHIFPVASIIRFYNGSRSTVDLLDLLRGKRRQASAKDQAFCTMRKWDNRAETGFIKSIESAFQPIARLVIANPARVLSPEENNAVSRFYALWRMRAMYRSKSNDDYKYKTMVEQERELTKDEQEQLESAGIMFTRNLGTPARIMHGMLLLRDVDYFLSLYPDISWSIWTVAVGEVIVPDYTNVLFVPLTPTLFLTSGKRPGLAHPQAMAVINKTLMSDAKEYVFAQDLSNCLGISRNTIYNYHKTFVGADLIKSVITDLVSHPKSVPNKRD